MSPLSELLINSARNGLTKHLHMNLHSAFCTGKAHKKLCGKVNGSFNPQCHKYTSNTQDLNICKSFLRVMVLLKLLKRQLYLGQSFQKRRKVYGRKSDLAITFATAWIYYYHYLFAKHKHDQLLMHDTDSWFSHTCRSYTQSDHTEVQKVYKLQKWHPCKDNPTDFESFR